MNNPPLFDWLSHPDNDLVLLIIRGLPGSGKTFRALQLASGDRSIICSADEFLVENGEYVWSPERLYEAHKQCKKKARMMMQRRAKLVIVDNTNIRIPDVMPYFYMACQYLYRIRIEEPVSPWWEQEVLPVLLDRKHDESEVERVAKLLHSKCHHGVPLETMVKCVRKYSPCMVLGDLVRYALRGSQKQPLAGLDKSCAGEE